MKKTFTLGVLAGMSSLALAVPVVAQVAGAATDDQESSTVTTDKFRVRPEFKQPTLQEMIDNDTKLLATIDSMGATVKTATQAHKAALTAAVSITDVAAQKTAIQKANEDMRVTMHAAIAANPDLKGMMMSFGGPGGKHGGPGHMKMKGNLAKKFGMTEAELKTAIESGKTMEQIAAEKGVTLPARPAKGDHMKMKFAQ